MAEFYYSAKDSSGNYGLWVSDGTALGTNEILQGTQGKYDLGPYDFLQVADELFFGATNSTGDRGVWVTDGTTAGTGELGAVRVEHGFQSQQFHRRRSMKSFVVFAGGDASGNSGLWSTTGPGRRCPGNRTRIAERDHTRSEQFLRIRLRRGGLVRGRRCKRESGLVGHRRHVGRRQRNQIRHAGDLRASTPTTMRCSATTWCSKARIRTGTSACGSPTGPRPAPKRSSRGSKTRTIWIRARS